MKGGADHEDLHEQAESCLARFRRFGNLDDIDKAIEYGARALDLTPSGHPSMSSRISWLGVYYDERYRRLGNLDDINKSMECGVRALELVSENDPELSVLLGNMGISYGMCYTRIGRVEDLGKSIEYSSRALALTPDGHPHLPRRNSALGVAYTHRYRRMGDPADLEKSIEYKSRALDLTPDGHPDLPRRHAALGASYTHLYRRMGDPADLEKSIEYKSRALALTPDGHPDLPRRHAALGGSYSDRYRRMGELADLEKSIECDSRALALTPDGHPDLPRWYAALGVSYSDRYRRMGDPADLEKSIEYKSRALALTPDGHPDLPRRHAALGGSHTDRYQLMGELADLEQSVQCYSRALALTPHDHPDLPTRHFDWATSCHHQYQLNAHPSHLAASLHSFRKASHLSAASPRDVFHNAFRWAKLASDHTYLNPIEAFRIRYHDLSSADSVAVRAASAAIRSSEHSLALEWLEHARCIVWSQTLMLRSPSVAQQLHHASSGLPSPDSTVFLPEHRHRLAREYSDLLAQARSLSGLELFLQPAKADDLIRAARYGPVVVVNCHQSDCDALVILPGQVHIRHLALPNFTEVKAQRARSEIERMLRIKGLRERGFHLMNPPPDPDVGAVLAGLWKDLVRPVLDHLGYLDDPTNDLPHVTWCPTGVLSFLPLHAAGDYDQPRSRVFDYVISSYTPTLTALLSSAPTVANRPPQVLAIGQAATPGRSPLQGTVKELEYLRTHAQSRLAYAELTDSQATTVAVLDAMEQYDWVHLACHAHQNVDDPTKSGFFLHDGTLDLAAITQRSFRNKGPAFLSACQTATGDAKLPDEAIHLASGMLMAGYPSVIASMWSVVDEDAPFVADKVYGRLMKDGKVGNGEAGKALHEAVAGLREKVGEKEFGRWVPYIHIGS
ncbi:CHAT domain protein [Rhizoctonia solani]|uniref:CHAT domain protein n=1 Tax=Rhizoctonia solani TaxID=456999 RepID=A0A8H8T016_9AGAM|nr:CHAT domain protein [Rhizoctonia solani]QRW24209.1 CHAT domain protein [Rhizoctonia solani]